MINLFQFATDDKSLVYLSSIFGSMNGVIYNPEGAVGEITLLSTMFRTFNSIILAVGALIVVYVTIVGVLHTAHEGEFLGRKWNNIWIPIRTVLGIAALVPTGSGYSSIQIIMMWVIVQGIGAADTLWNTVLGFVDVAGSPYAQLTIPSVNVQSSLDLYFQGLVCEASARVRAPDPAGIPRGGYYCGIETTNQWCQNNPSNITVANSGIYPLGPAGACGTLKACNLNKACSDRNSLKCAGCTGQNVALLEIIPTLTAIANKYVETDVSYRDFYYNSYNQANNSSWQWIYNYCQQQNPPIPQDHCCIPSKRALVQTCKAVSSAAFPSPNYSGTPQNPSDKAVRDLYWTYSVQPFLGGADDFIGIAVTNYIERVNGAITSFMAGQGQKSKNLSGDLAKAQKTGWMLAGGYYYTLAQMNNNNLDEAIPPIEMAAEEINSTPMKNYRNNHSAASVLLDVSSGQQGGTFSATPQLSGMGKAMRGATTGVAKAMDNTTNGVHSSNPLVVMGILGHVMLITALLTYAVMLVFTVAAGIIGFVTDFFVIGNGDINPAGPTFIMLYFLLVPVVFGFLGILISVGGTMSVILPLTPYVIFTFGAIGWLISTIEAMVAGPLAALGILSPSGEHELLGKAHNGLMLLFNIFLRPSLMIFGLMAALLLASVVVDLINAGFGPVVKSITVGTGIGAVDPIGLVLILIAYVTLIFTSLNKCFEAIYVIPERVMRWVGGSGEQYGEAQAAGAVKEAGESGGRKTAGGLEGQSASKGIGETAGNIRKRKDAREEAIKREEASAKGGPKPGT